MTDYSRDFRSLLDLQTAVDLAIDAQAGLTGILHLSVFTEEGIWRTQDVKFPSNWTTERRECLVRYGAARLNNLAMIFGGSVIECSSDFKDLTSEIIQLVQMQFPQVTQVLSQFCGRPISMRGTGDCSLFASPPPDVPQSGLTYPHAGRIALGVNIGQTLTKVTMSVDGVERDRARVVVPTWRQGTPRTFETLFNNLACAIDDSRKKNGLPFEAIGVAVGGIVRDGCLVTRSGVAAQLPGRDTHEFASVASRLGTHFNACAVLCQDTAAKAHAIRLMHSGDMLVLDIGTSTGGAFIAADGSLPDFLNQVGRTVIDVSHDAVARDDGQARGVLSKYASVTGFERLCSECGLIGHSADAIASLADEGDSHAVEVVSRFSELICDSIQMLHPYYRASLVVLTGGILSTRLGSKLMDNIHHRSADAYTDFPTVILSSNPLFDGSVGASLIAANRVSSVERALTEMRSGIERAVGAKPKAFTIPQGRRLRMDSERGRSHYDQYNADFIRRYINFGTKDPSLQELLVGKLLPEVSRPEAVGSLTPQEVQSAAARAIAHGVARYDPCLPLKRRSNLAAQRMVGPLSEWVTRSIRDLDQQPEKKAALLRALLTLSGLMNGNDFFHQDSEPDLLKPSLSSASGIGGQGASSFLLDAAINLFGGTSTIVAFDEFSNFYAVLEKCPQGSILYFLDNAGEVVVDLIVAEVLLKFGFRIVLVATKDPFVDDITIDEVHHLVRTSSSLASFARSGQLRLVAIDDMMAWGEDLHAEAISACGYIAKGMRKLSQLYDLNWQLCGLHVTLNKSDTVRMILQRDRTISLDKERAESVVMLYAGRALSG